MKKRITSKDLIKATKLLRREGELVGYRSVTFNPDKPIKLFLEIAKHHHPVVIQDDEGEYTITYRPGK